MGGGAGGLMSLPPSEPARRGDSLGAEEALSKQRNAAWNPGDGGGEEGGGGADQAAELPAPSCQPGGDSPHLQPRLQRRGRAKSLLFAAVFQFTFANPVGSASCHSAARCATATHPEPELHIRSVPAAGQGVTGGGGGGGAALRSKCPESAKRWDPATRVPSRPHPPSHTLRGAGEQT